MPEPMFSEALTSGRPYTAMVSSMESAEQLSLPSGGCWIANDIALANPCVTTPGYMPPGRYLAEVVIGYENGDGDKKQSLISLSRGRWGWWG